MANQEDIASTYDYVDELFRLTRGEMGDASCALFDGDYTKSLQQAQRDKHEFILQSICFEPGQRVLDIGCGWGPMLRVLRDLGGQAVGITLAQKQLEACRKFGFDVHLVDWRDMSPQTFGTFDAIVSVEAFDHFCSRQEYLDGEQEAIYRRFFALCHSLLPPGGRMYLQVTMFGPTSFDYDRLSVKARPGTNEHIMALIEKYFPGSWLPYGEAQILRCSESYFRTVFSQNGREDYVYTQEQWIRRTLGFDVRKIIPVLKLIPHFFRDQDFRYKMETTLRGYNIETFRRGLFDMQRFVFERL